MKNLFTLEDPGCDFSILQKMAEEGDIKAKVELATCYRDRFDATDDDLSKAIELLEYAAKKGDDNAMAELWMTYLNLGDDKTANKWIKKMHDLHVKNHQKSPSLQTEFNLAFDMQFGFGVEQNISETKRIFESLAKRGFGEAFCGLGLMYEDGPFRKNKSAAIRRYKKGAELYDPNCMMRMAEHYMESGEDYNPEEAYRLYHTLSKYKYGWPEAQVKMAEYYTYELYGNDKADWEKAKRYLEAASSLGSHDAAIFLKALTLAEEECIKVNGSLENTPKEQKGYRLAAAMETLRNEFWKI